MDPTHRASDVRRRLASLSAVYLLTSFVGTWVAISRDLPGSPLGVRTGLPVEWDFVFGLGTALSAPLVLLVTLVGLNIWMMRSPDPRATKGIGILGVGFLVGMLAEPILGQALTGAHDAVVIAVVLANLVVPIALVVGALVALGCWRPDGSSWSLKASGQ